MNEEHNNPVLDRESYCNWISSVEDQSGRNVLHMVLPRAVCDSVLEYAIQDAAVERTTPLHKDAHAPMQHYFSTTVPIVLLVSDDFRMWTPVDRERVEEIPGWVDWLKNQELRARALAEKILAMGSPGGRQALKELRDANPCLYERVSQHLKLLAEAALNKKGDSDEL
jgi:hypothetical protein